VLDIRISLQAATCSSMHVLRDREEDFVATNNPCLSTWKYSVLSCHETGVEIIKKVCFIVDFLV
jgi:hypothetical protein